GALRGVRRSSADHVARRARRARQAPGRVGPVNLVGWIVVGLVAGGLARSVTGGGWNLGCLGTIVVGVVGGLIGGVLFCAAGGEGVGAFGVPPIFVPVVCGVCGGLIGGMLCSAAGDEGIGDFGLRSIFVAFVGAVVLLALVGLVSGRGCVSRAGGEAPGRHRTAR